MSGDDAGGRHCSRGVINKDQNGYLYLGKCERVGGLGLILITLLGLEVGKDLFVENMVVVIKDLRNYECLAWARWWLVAKG